MIKIKREELSGVLAKLPTPELTSIMRESGLPMVERMSGTQMVEAIAKLPEDKLKPLLGKHGIVMGNSHY